LTGAAFGDSLTNLTSPVIDPASAWLERTVKKIVTTAVPTIFFFMAQPHQLAENNVQAFKDQGHPFLTNLAREVP
jgi:hypothetical protein